MYSAQILIFVKAMAGIIQLIKKIELIEYHFIHLDNFATHSHIKGKKV